MDEQDLSKFINSIHLENLDNFDLVNAKIEKINIDTLVKDNNEKDLLNKIINFLQKVFKKLQESYNYLRDNSPIIITLEREVKALWFRISPEIKNVLVSSSKIYKNIALFTIGLKQYSINLIYDTQKNIVIFFSDLFCLVINGLFSSTESEPIF